MNPKQTNPTATTLTPKPDARGSHRVALTALATMLVDANLPPAVLEHLKAAHLELVEHATTAPVGTSEEGGIPAGESIAASKRRANGEDPAAKDDEDPDGDNAPGDKAKGDKPNPLAKVSGLKAWASTKEKDEPTPPKKAAPPAGRVTAGKPRFFGRGR